MFKRKMFLVLVLFALASMVLSAYSCTPQIQKSGAEGTATAMIAAAKDQSLLMTAGAEATKIAGGQPASAQSTAQPPVVQATAVVPPAAPAAGCRDGELVLVHAADLGEFLDRLPVGEAERADIMEISHLGNGFGHYDRAIIVLPRLGPVWMVDVVKGAKTVATRGFCGTNEAVAQWAVTAHVPSLQQASRDSEGKQPPESEIAVYRLDFEARALIVVKPATAGNAPTPEEILTWIEVSFHEGGTVSYVPLHVVR